MIVSLAFVPQENLVEAFTDLENFLPIELEPILSYFTNTYIGRIRNNGTRAPPIFVPNSWNVIREHLTTWTEQITSAKRFIKRCNYS